MLLKRRNGTNEGSRSSSPDLEHASTLWLVKNKKTLSYFCDFKVLKYLTNPQVHLSHRSIQNAWYNEIQFLIVRD